MKKIIFIAAIVMFYFGCSKSNNVTPVSASIVAQWYKTTDTTRVYANNVLQQTTPSSYNRTDYVKFNADGTGTASSSGTLIPFTYVLSNSTLTINEAAYTSNNVSVSAVTETGTVKVLTATNFVVEFDLSSVVSGVTYLAKGISYYTK